MTNFGKSFQDLHCSMAAAAYVCALVHFLCTVITIVPTHVHAQGSWELLLQNAGIASMHTAVTHQGTVVFLDRTDIGASQIRLPNGRCRSDPNDETLTYDCTAHSVEFTPGSNNIRPLYISTDTWCSSGQFFPNGTLVQTGGDNDGLNKIRYFSPCPPGGSCDWVEDNTQNLQNGRWYASNQLLPDGTQIVVGGRSVFTVEYVPAKGRGTFTLPLLQTTNDYENDNYYPYVHLLPTGNLFIFANRDSILYNHYSNKAIKSFPTIPGEPRNYPSAGSSVMLTLQASNGYSRAEILICGGAQLGAYANPSASLPASITCGRMVVTDTNPFWAMENMPVRRNMGDMVLLPTQNVLIINGAQNGAQGWGNAANAVLTPVMYNPSAAAGARFQTQAATNIPRVYHSTANLLPDGRVLVAGSNTHQYYVLTGTFPTELRVEAFSPAYLGAGNNYLRPSITSYPNYFKYNSVATITLNVQSAPGTLNLVLLSAPFTTHSYSMGQRAISLAVSGQVAAGNNKYQVTATAPLNANVAPPSYYMLFAVNAGIPSKAVWITVNY